jgi:PadR family transcriptional regulator, regulatory protein AphA
VKKVYAITARGKKELLAWLEAPVENQPLRNELLLKVFFGGRIGAGSVRDMVRAENDRNRELVSIFSGIRTGMKNSQAPDAPYWEMTIDFGIRKSEMIIEWCDEALKALGRLQ